MVVFRLKVSSTLISRKNWITEDKIDNVSENDKTCYFFICNFFSILQIYNAVRQKGNGIQMTQELCRHHASEIFNELLDLPDGEAKSALEKLLNYLKQWNIFAQIWMIRKTTTTYSNIFLLRNSTSVLLVGC